MKVNTAKAVSGMSSFSKTLSKFGSKLNPLQAGLGGFTAALAGVAGVGLSVAGVIGGITSAMGDIDKVAKTSAKLGLTTEALTGLHHAAELTGVGVATMDMAIQRMTRRVAEAALGTGEAKAAIKELGLDAQQLASMSPDKQLQAFAGAMQNVSNQGDKVRLAMKLFDSEGVALVNTLGMGADGLKAMEERAKELGVSFSNVDAAKVEMANDAIFEMKQLFIGLFQQAAIKLAPIIQTLATDITNFATSGGDAGDVVSKSFEVAATSIGYTADAVDLVRDTFLAVQAGMTKGLALLATGWKLQAQAIQAVLNLLPGVEVQFTDTITAIADDLHKLAGEQWESAKQSFSEPPPSKAIQQWFADVEKRSTEAAEALQMKSALKAQAEALTELNKPAVDFIQNLQLQIDTFGMSSTAAQIYKLRMQGVSDVLLKTAESQAAHLESMQRAKSLQEDLAQRARTVFDNTRTPMEEFRSSLTELKTLFSKGLISKDTFSRGVAEAKKQLGGIFAKPEGEVAAYKKQVRELWKLYQQGAITRGKATLEIAKLNQQFTGSNNPFRAGNAVEAGTHNARRLFLQSKNVGNNPTNDIVKNSKLQIKAIEETNAILKQQHPVVFQTYNLSP